ncbi:MULTISPECIES: hypothetical protein [Thermoanaerobacterium]|uniref:Uncharacterized protein n=2 Tax=Thermoanaerobacterium TaxID=28895 RepID=W9EDG9_9THEO|nr:MULTISPECIES: hypothetical protein [Thermoanaerobacterium]AFK87428.1 hypothetical protein Tsac_2430 [Thermoanaerobacterium saccharolyticum JW/SL-YS485]ETO37799.1 hypothetical protein V518_2053 [Thermoanaerobacterium aotearoense SCUT27]
MVEGLIGTLVGGILSWIGSYFSLREEFINQKKLNKREEIKKEKSAFLVLKDELEENKIVIRGYINFMDSNNKLYIDFRNDNINQVRDQAWKQVRERIFLCDDGITGEISKFYKVIYGMENADMMRKEDVDIMYNECKKLMNEIVEHVKKLEGELDRRKFVKFF